MAILSWPQCVKDNQKPYLTGTNKPVKYVKLQCFKSTVVQNGCSLCSTLPVIVQCLQCLDCALSCCDYIITVSGIISHFNKYSFRIDHRYWSNHPDSKVHGANMGPIWGRQDPGGPHVGPMNFAIWTNYWSTVSQVTLEHVWMKLGNEASMKLPF